MADNAGVLGDLSQSLKDARTEAAKPPVAPKGTAKAPVAPKDSAPEK